MIEVLARDGLYLVDTEHSPRKWLSDVVPKTEVEGVVFLAFSCVDKYDRDDKPAGKSLVLLRLDAIVSVQEAL